MYGIGQHNKTQIQVEEEGALTQATEISISTEAERGKHSNNVTMAGSLLQHWYFFLTAVEYETAFWRK